MKTSDCNTANCATAKCMKTKQLETSDTRACPLSGEYDIKYFGNPFYGSNGEVVGAMEIIIDETAAKKIQKRKKFMLTLAWLPERRFGFNLPLLPQHSAQPF